MESDAGSSIARRRRRLFSAFHLLVSLSLHFNRFVDDSLVLLGFLISFTVVSYKRWCRCSLFILWLLCSPCPSLMTPLDPDQTSMTYTPTLQEVSSEISDLKMQRRALPFSSPRTMIVHPSGKIDSVWFWCDYGSCTSLFWPLFIRSLCLKSSEHFNRTTPARNSLFNDPLTNLCSPRTLLIHVLSHDNNDQRLSFDFSKSSWFYHGPREIFFHLLFLKGETLSTNIPLRKR
ncbi:unnamed protein product [Eruca vesicaria subsp. sativa]|uniref:Uncharacterized protein n=1 Tax=Eruca vesicaria subsp. sativa TaxID=29727 RepID=A0ABC8JJM5_ERUVS|nr:unnamed protein product [Eruca vesicaria subsp. sativa]